MQAELAANAPAVGETYAEASNELGFDLWDLVQNGPKETLDETVNTQQAMLAAGVAAWRSWRQAGGAAPQMVAGHSLGEYAALVAAGVLEFRDAVSVVRRRAELMQGAVPPGEGAMAAILGLDDQVVVDVCRDASSVGVAEAVNFNSPGQVVIAGAHDAIAKAIELAREAGARRALLLAVSVPAHSSLMQPAGEELAESIAATRFSEPSMPVVCAVDGTLYGDANDIRDRLQKQVYSPVRWVDTVRQMTSAGITSIVECGPGKVLAGLIRRIDRDVTAATLDSADDIQTLKDGATE
jgi:[acyl-carrier-protein] S-malonyltransferase